MPVSRVIETLVSGMSANQRSHDVIANNMANVNTTGFKKDKAVHSSFATTLSKAQRKVSARRSLADEIYRTNLGDKSTVRVNYVGTSYRVGAPRQTGNTFDLTVTGKGFFRVRTQDGLRYTRDGSFRLNSKNELVTAQGDQVLGIDEKGGIGIPIVIDGTDVTFVTDGSVKVDGLPVAKLIVTDFADYDKLEKRGNSQFAYTGDVREAYAAEDVQIEQGCLEQSNVNALAEMTAMIANTRHYDMAGRSLKSVEQTLNRAIVDVPKFNK